MDATLAQPNDQTRIRERGRGSVPYLVELVGPAGVGKTTLARVLRQRRSDIVVARDISIRSTGYAQSFVRSLPALLPIWFGTNGFGRWFTWDEIKAMVYLQESPRVLRLTAKGMNLVILDHGPIFKLATLHAFGPDRLRQPAADRWWNAMCRKWAGLLQAVVWLDAPDHVLITRINARPQGHLVKGKTEEEATRFIAHYRASYQHILSKLAAAGSRALLSFDTNQTPTEIMTEAVLAACEMTEPNLAQRRA